MSETIRSEGTRATSMTHIRCGGMVLVSLDADFCARCGKELREDEWLLLSPDDLYSDARSWPTGLPGGTP